MNGPKSVMTKLSSRTCVAPCCLENNPKVQRKQPSVVLNDNNVIQGSGSCHGALSSLPRCFRLFHKLPTELRQMIIGELCGVSRHYVLLSYDSGWPYISLNRMLRVVLGGHKPDKWATSLMDLNAHFAHFGFELLKDFAQSPWLLGLHLSMWQRIAHIPMVCWQPIPKNGRRPCDMAPEAKE